MRVELHCTRSTLHQLNPDSEPERKANRLRDRLKEATADAILSAAEQVFAEQGLHAARMEDIALRAGVSVGTLYNYFADRGTLFSELLESRRVELIQRVDDALSEVRSSFELELEALFRTLFEHFEDHRPFLSIVLAGEHVKDSGPDTGSRETMRALYERFERVVGHGLSSGALSHESAALYPALLMGMARGVLVRSLHDAAVGSTALHARDVVRLFMRGAQR